MKVLKDTSDEQTVYFTARSYPGTINYKIIEEGNNRLAEETGVSTSVINGFLTFLAKFQLNEDNFYSLYIYDASNGELIHRDKAFCTNQYVTDYTINENEYVTDDTYDSDYVIYGDDNEAPDTPTLNSVTET